MGQQEVDPAEVEEEVLPVLVLFCLDPGFFLLLWVSPRIRTSLCCCVTLSRLGSCWCEGAILTEQRSSYFRSAVALGGVCRGSSCSGR